MSESASAVLSALDAAVERYGRSAVTDPVALSGALRAATDPPPEPVVAALARVVSTGAVGALRDALGRDADPADALAAAVAVAGQDTDPVGQPVARWACTLLGAALGLLPREWALRAGPLRSGDGSAPRDAATGSGGVVAPADPTVDVSPEVVRAALADAGSGPTAQFGPTASAVGQVRSGPGPEHGARSAGPSTASRPGRRRGVVLAAVLAVAVLVAAGGLYAALAPGSPAGAASAGAVADVDVDVEATTAPAPPTSAVPTTAAPATSAPGSLAGAPADPRQAFSDPGLLALAEPYISAPGVVCIGKDPQVNQQETVTCDLGGGWIALFSKMLTPDLLRDLRGGFLQGHNAAPGSTRSLRWKYTDRPGVKTGIRAGSPERGEGVRVRFIDVDGITPRLYFDQDSTASSGFIASVDPSRDLDDLRSFWAAPAG